MAVSPEYGMLLLEIVHSPGAVIIIYYWLSAGLLYCRVGLIDLIRIMGARNDDSVLRSYSDVRRILIIITFGEPM